MILDGGFGRSVVRGAGLAFGVALVAGLLFVGLRAINVLLLVFIAVILASGLQPFIAWIRGHLSLGRGPTILLVYGVFLAAVIGMAVVIVPGALTQFERVTASLPPFFDRAREWAGTLRPSGLASSLTALIDAAARTLRPSNADPAPGQAVQLGLTVAETITTVLTLLTVVYFWLTEHARLQRYALAFVPQPRRKRARDVWNAAETRLGMWVRGQLILMGTIGIGTAVAYTLLGVPAGILLGLIAALAEAIPIVGPLLGAIPAVLVAATVSPELALAVAGVYLVLQLIEGNVLVPGHAEHDGNLAVPRDPQRPGRRGGRRLHRCPPGRADRRGRRGHHRRAPGARGPGRPGPDVDREDRRRGERPGRPRHGRAAGHSGRPRRPGPNGARKHDPAGLTAC